jgi:hypothetical protein
VGWDPGATFSFSTECARVSDQGTQYTPYFAAGAALLGYLSVLVRHGPLVKMTDAVKDEIIRQVTFYGILGIIAGAILDYA